MTNCVGQQTKSSEEKSLRLVEPKMGKESIASEEDYKHCINLAQNNFKIVINGKEYVCSDKQELISLIERNRKNITKRTISIIYNSETLPKRVVYILDILTDQKIKNFKLVSVDGKLPNTLSSVDVGKSLSQEIDLSDSTVLIISIRDTCVDVSLLKNIEACKQITDVEKFIIINKRNIDPNKVLLVGKKDLPYKNLKPIVSLLTKYEYFNFHIISKN